MIDKPTRIAEQSKTLLDHHYLVSRREERCVTILKTAARETNHYCAHPEHVVCTFSSYLGLSDHNPTVLVRRNAEKVANTSGFLFAP